MPPDRFLADATAGDNPSHENVQQLIEAESGKGTQGIRRSWQASDSSRVVLTSDATGVKISRDNGTTAPAQVVVDGTPAGGHLAGAYPNPTLLSGIVDAIQPVGSIVAYGGAAAPAGWLLCDGVLRAVAAFPRLAAVLGATYGGDGTTTFAVPDLRGRVPLGASATHPQGQVTTAETAPGPAHTHAGSHSHGMNSHTHGPGLHTHGLNSHTHGPGLHTHGVLDHAHTMSAHTHDINHDHAVAAGAATASASTLNGRFAGPASINALPDTHTHPVDLPPLGATASAIPSTPNTGDTHPDTGGPSAAATGAATGTTAGPDAAATAAATGTTADDSSAPVAVYGGVTISIMQSHVAVQYIIRTG
jgi:microcystin-dependent protein